MDRLISVQPQLGQRRAWRACGRGNAVRDAPSAAGSAAITGSRMLARRTGSVSNTANPESGAHTAMVNLTPRNPDRRGIGIAARGAGISRKPRKGSSRGGGRLGVSRAYKFIVGVHSLF